MTETAAQITDQDVFPDLRKPPRVRDFGQTIKSGQSNQYFTERGNSIISPRKNNNRDDTLPPLLSQLMKGNTFENNFKEIIDSKRPMWR
jgi:hypothetical protein